MMNRTVSTKPSLHEPRWATHHSSLFVVRHNSASRAISNTSDEGHLPMAPPAPTSLPAATVKADTDVLFSTLYAELHRLAKRQLARQWTPAALGVTTLL